MELLTILLFSIIILGSVILDISIIIPLIIGYIIFIIYGLMNGHKIKSLIRYSFNGVKTVKNILLIFIFIGMITALWRMGGTIPYLVYYASSLCTPKMMLLITFILCSIISVLTGTSFGTSATIGVICMSISNGMGIPVYLSGGAILAGSFFGDRCSPMSTSALLVSEVSKTNLFDNIRGMIRTGTIPFIISCLLYLIIGFNLNTVNAASNIRFLLSDNFELSIIMIIPALIIVVLSLMKVNVKKTMGISIISSIVILLIMDNNLNEIIRVAIMGYRTSNSELNRIIAGGGIISMVKVFIIICISSSYAGIFDGTNFLDNIKNFLNRMNKYFNTYTIVLFTSLITSIISCNQTLAIILTFELCKDLESKEALALDLENSAILIPALIPWAIAGAVPLNTVNAPVFSIFFAFYLYLIPLCELIKHYFKRKHLSV